MNSSFCFQSIGLDYAEPLFVKDTSSKTTKKVYILLLTCATSKAIHLELTPNMNAPAFLRGFKRFTSRRGTPELIVHDNFKIFNSITVKRYMLHRGVIQKFILRNHHGGGSFYERLVRSVTSYFQKVLGKSLLIYEELEKVLSGVEKAISRRPLVYTCEDDLHAAITLFYLFYRRNIS